MKQIKMNLVSRDNYMVQEAYKILRTNLQFSGADIKTIVITSCTENEGKSTIALHLAASFAELGKKVLLIDTDMRKSVMAVRDSNAEEVLGLSEYLTRQASLEDCIVQTQLKPLHILFAGKFPPNPVELLNTKYFKELIAQMREQYDYIIIDTPPLGVVIDAAVVAALCDGAIIVISDRKIQQTVAKDVVEKIKLSGCRVLGAITNNTRYRKFSRYYGGYYSKYYYSHYYSKDTKMKKKTGV